MRHLSDIELQLIKHRLDRLQIAYLEIYNELLDHYISELEQKDQSRFYQELGILNEIFAWSIVKKMKSNLEKNNQKQVAKMQWNALKIWKFSLKEVIQSIFLISILFAAYLLLQSRRNLFDIKFFGIFSDYFSVKLSRKRDKFFFKYKKQKPVSCVSKTILLRLGILYVFLSWFWVAVDNWGTSNPGSIGNNLGITICISLFLYITSLLKVALTYIQSSVNLPSS